MVSAAPAAATNQTPGSRYLDDAAEIGRLFVSFRDQRVALTLRFANQPKPVSATILDVTDTDLLIEDIQPRSALRLLRDGQAFSLACRSEGQYLLAENAHVHRADAERGLPYFYVKLPDSVLYQQRRRHQRVALPLSIQTKGAVLHLGDGLKADIVDLSAGGCLARFTQSPLPDLVESMEITDALLQIRDQLELHSDLRVRHFHHDRQSGVALCGVEFAKMSITDRRRLERFVSSCHRRDKE